MNRWRWLFIILLAVALALWAVPFMWNWHAEIPRIVRPPFMPSDGFSGDKFGQSLSGLPAWASSIGLYITLFLAGLANFYLFPLRVRAMRGALTGSFRRFVQIMFLGFGFCLLLAAFGLGAVLARITFPFTILSALSFFFLGAWGFLSVAYNVGRSLLIRTGWFRSSPALQLALGLLLLLPLARIPFGGGLFMLIFLSLGLGVVIVTRFGSAEPWNLIALLEEDKS